MSALSPLCMRCGARRTDLTPAWIAEARAERRPLQIDGGEDFMFRGLPLDREPPTSCPRCGSQEMHQIVLVEDAHAAWIGRYIETHFWHG